jgi:hypothetical protein
LILGEFDISLKEIRFLDTSVFCYTKKYVNYLYNTLLL